MWLLNNTNFLTDKDRLANLVIPVPLRFKPSSMPFVQMENISLFLRACQSPPLGLQPHDVFLTVDLYESKDPAQVLQCIGAFSRAANRVNPSKIPSVIGPPSRNPVLSPQGTGKVGGGSFGSRARGTSNVSNNSSAYSQPSRAGAMTPTRTGDSNSGRWSPTKDTSRTMSPGVPVSSWSKKSDEHSSAPAWNIAQYGYMGGASQGTMGVSFGAKRQITSAGPHVPSLAEKEKKRREAEEDAERQRQQLAEAERQRRAQSEAEEEQARIEEEERWAAETQRLREQELQAQADEKRRWEEEERRWKLEEEARAREEKEAQARLEQETQRPRTKSDVRLQGQFLSQYQAEQAGSSDKDDRNLSRIEQLEKELEEARAREAQYESERQARFKNGQNGRDNHDSNGRPKEQSTANTRARSRSRPGVERKRTGEVNREESWRENEREYLSTQYNEHRRDEEARSPRPLPDLTPVRVKTNNTGPSSRPLPDPAVYTSPQPAQAETFSSPPAQLPSRTDRYLATNPAPAAAAPRQTYASELGAFDSNAERDAEDRRRKESQQKTKAGGWASKSLLEREMELERQRQQEWEESQKATAARQKPADGVNGIGGGIGGSHDISQWSSYTRGDNQNRGAQGIGSGRRQIVGPRPPPAK